MNGRKIVMGVILELVLVTSNGGQSLPRHPCCAKPPPEEPVVLVRIQKDGQKKELKKVRQAVNTNTRRTKSLASQNRVLNRKVTDLKREVTQLRSEVDQLKLSERANRENMTWLDKFRAKFSEYFPAGVEDLQQRMSSLSTRVDQTYGWKTLVPILLALALISVLIVRGVERLWRRRRIRQRRLATTNNQFPGA